MQLTLTQEAAGNGAKLVVLPEMWNCPYSNDSFPTYAEDIDGGASESAQLLSDAAKEHGVTLVGGSIPETSAGHLYNTCCVYGPDGALLGKHRKVRCALPTAPVLVAQLAGISQGAHIFWPDAAAGINGFPAHSGMSITSSAGRLKIILHWSARWQVHLFDIDIPGKMTFKESETLSPGQLGTVVKTPAGTIAIGICYDLRFPELAQLYARKDAHIIIYPGAEQLSLLKSAARQSIEVRSAHSSDLHNQVQEFVAMATMDTTEIHELNLG